MSTHKLTYYDDPSYDYEKYWRQRGYESKAEEIALKKLLKLIPQKRKLIDIGGGFGRLAELYAKMFQKCLLVDPSEKLLKTAKTKLAKYKNIRFKKGESQQLPASQSQFDVALMIRVSHHLSHLEKPLQEAHRVLKPGGFLILEFANKMHLKSILRAIFRGKLNYLLSHIPANISTQKDVLFLNYHPTHVKSLLLSNGFVVNKTLSVSNFRNPVFKKIIPQSLLLRLESWFQSLFAPLHLGPSIFILAQKT